MDLRYISDFDELTWLIDVENHAFYECNIPWSKRSDFVKWMHECLSGVVYVWNGLLQPEKGVEHGWGDLVSPNERTAYFVFMHESDATAFLMEFGSTDFFLARHSSGDKAYHARKSLAK